MGEIIAVTSQKGGVGKTTTAVNLSASLAVLDRKILLIDVDPQGSVGTSFGLKKYDINSGIYNLMADTGAIYSAIYKTELINLDIMPANVWTEEDESQLRERMSDVKKLKLSLDEIKSKYEFIFIDCPPSMDVLALSALIASDSIIVPIQCEYYSLRALGRFLKFVRGLAAKYDFTLRYKGFLLTMVDLRSNLARRVAKEVRDTLKMMVFQTMIPRNIKLAEVPLHGKPTILFDAVSRGAEAHLKLAQEFLDRSV